MAAQLHQPALHRSLSARLLVLTMAFVLLGEVLIYVPSIARFRKAYLDERIAAAHLATLSLEASPDGRISEELEQELLSQAGVLSVTLREPAAELMLGKLPPVEQVFDLSSAGPAELIGDAFESLWHGGTRTIRVIGPSPARPSVLVDISLHERGMWNAMVGYSWRILTLTVILSLVTALLVYGALQLMFVRPVRRITDSVIAFRSRPEDASVNLPPSERRDEIGLVQTELSNMQRALRTALAQKTRLAAVGIAVSKINHDLRNILATAQLVSDRLAQSADPEVRRLTPTLLGAIDRAVGLCGEVLHLARIGYLRLASERVSLREIVDEAGDAILASPRASGEKGEMVWRNEVAAETAVQGDRAQLTRVLDNLGRNAFEAGATTVTVTVETTQRFVFARIKDDGPGLPETVQSDLFRPFAASMRGGSGLGLAIARELVVAQSGSIKLERTGPEGTEIAVVLPAARRHG
jgi:signal transduction histidine kinase